MAKAGGKRRTLTWLMVGLVLVTVLGGLAFYRPFASKVTGIDGGADPTPATPPPPPLPVQRTTFLVMGVDKRDDDSGRADSMMVVTFDPGTQKLAALSLPRDLWVEIPGHGYDKINHSYAFGGDKLAVATVQKLLGIPIDHYVTVTFQSFARIVDAVGGIDIDAEKRMEYRDPSDTGMGPDGLVIDIQPGQQHMDGLTALKYARYRMDDEGDLGRVRRQQQVAKAMMTAAARPAILGKVGTVIPAMSDAIDTDLTVADMLKLGMGGLDALKKPLKTGTVAGDPMALGGIFYLSFNLESQRMAAYDVLVGTPPTAEFSARAKADNTAYQKVLAEAKQHDLATAEKGPGQGAQPGGTQQLPPAVKPPVKNQPLTVAVVDASGKNIAAAWVPKLRAAGFRVARVGKAARPVTRTVAIDHAGQPGTEQRIHGVLPTALIVPHPDAKAEEAVEIVLGQDLLPKGR